MTEIENFLSKEECKHLIEIYKNNSNKAEHHEGRTYKLVLHDGGELTNNSFLNMIIKKYQQVRPIDYLANLEIVYWPQGVFMDWHDDLIYYNHSTITNLNDDYEGGRTLVEDYEVKPSIGKLVLFGSEKMHKVTRLEKNVRYVIGAWYKNIDRK